MSKKRRKNRNYHLTGSVEVYNITPGRRKGKILDLDQPIITKIVEISGSIVTKSPIYHEDVTKDQESEEISSK